MILIVALPHSGTLYISTVLKNLGLEVGHERRGKDGSVAWHLAAVGPPWDIGRLPGLLRPYYTHYDCILHQVRHPLKVLTTLAHKSVSALLWPFVCAHTTCTEREPSLLRAMKFWCQWNEFDERCAEGKTYRIEELPERFEWFCEQLGVSPRLSKMESVPKTTNSHRHGVSYFTWDDLYTEDCYWAERIEAKAREYGYEGGIELCS